MALSSRRTRLLRIVVALILAAVTGGRGGGVALACESISVAASRGEHAMADMPGMADHAPAHDAGSGDGCDSSDRARECPLMIGCAPALLTTISNSGERIIGGASAIEWRVASPTDTVRQPEPPPPRT